MLVGCFLRWLGLHTVSSFVIPGWMSNEYTYEWRQLLKKYLLIERGWKSDLSDMSVSDRTGCHVHEAIASRAVVPKSLWWQYKIFHPYNCLLLLPEEHIPMPPSREQAIEILAARYGIDSIREWWYNELNWKVVPFHI